jgi:hypothetical protein
MSQRMIGRVLLSEGDNEISIMVRNEELGRRAFLSPSEVRTLYERLGKWLGERQSSEVSE